ncbi:MAG: DUF3306 domain-containing protein [Pseudomonadota bacterium]
MGRESKPGQETSDSQEDFLARWSRRKVEEQQGTVHDETAALQQQAGSTDNEPARELTDADMPPLESLNEDSDFAPFLSTGVSDSLRKKALRILFGQSAFNITDGLNDYDEDFTEFADLGNVITHEMKRALQRELTGEKTATTAVDKPVADDGPDESGVETENNSNNEAAESDVDTDDPEKGGT